MKKIKSVNLMVTGNCNGACNMCNIWKTKADVELDIETVNKFFSSSEFSEVEDLSISGGEPFLKSDLSAFSISLLTTFPKLKMMFINTNGLNSIKTIEFARSLSAEAMVLNKDLKIYISISIEGPKEIHEYIRGRSYDLSLQTVLSLKKLNLPNIDIALSMTIQKANAAYISWVRDLARNNNCNFSFRFVDFSDNYYDNSDTRELSLGRLEAVELLQKIKNDFIDDRFFRILYNSVCSNNNEVMINKNGELICEAGNLFIFVKNDGNVYPCIYSNQIIGNIKTGLRPFKLQRLKSCPCCTECHIYPMINFSKNK